MEPTNEGVKKQTQWVMVAVVVLVILGLVAYVGSVILRMQRERERAARNERPTQEEIMKSLSAPSDATSTPVNREVLESLSAPITKPVGIIPAATQVPVSQEVINSLSAPSPKQ